MFSSLHGDGACDHDTEEATDSLPPKQFSKDVLDAVQWACGIKKTHEVALQDLCRALPAWCVEEQVQKYKSRDPAKARRTKKRKTCGVYANPTLQKRLEAAEEFTRFIRGRGIDIEQAKKCKKGLLSLPYGTFGAFLETVPELKKRCTTKARKDKWRQFYLRAERSYRQDKGLYAFGEQAEAAKHLPRGSGKKAYIRDQFRRRAMGAGRKKKARVLREMLYEWFSSIRHSVKGKGKARFPKKVLEQKAKLLLQQYCKALLMQGEAPLAPEVNDQWLKRWMLEYRVCLRKPNRKFKVPKQVLEERLMIFWLNLARARKFVMMHKGYDPEMDNLDQTPYHMNEAGMQC